MNDELTKIDLQKMKEELSQLESEWPAIIEEVKRTRAFGDLSENYEYKAAKQAQNHNRSRRRYLEGMIKTARVIDDSSAEDEIGLFDRVTVYIPEDEEEMTVSIVSTVRVDPVHNLMSRESPFGKALLGRHEGEKVTVETPGGGYEVIIRSITKAEDDGSAPILKY